jgi:hypothetical protein
MVVLPGCILSDLSREVAEAFVAAYHRLKTMDAV